MGVYLPPPGLMDHNVNVLANMHKNDQACAEAEAEMEMVDARVGVIDKQSLRDQEALQADVELGMAIGSGAMSTAGSVQNCAANMRSNLSAAERFDQQMLQPTTASVEDQRQSAGKDLAVKQFTAAPGRIFDGRKADLGKRVQEGEDRRNTSVGLRDQFAENTTQTRNLQAELASKMVSAKKNA